MMLLLEPILGSVPSQRLAHWGARVMLAGDLRWLAEKKKGKTSANLESNFVIGLDDNADDKSAQKWRNSGHVRVKTWQFMRTN